MGDRGGSRTGILLISVTGFLSRRALVGVVMFGIAIYLWRNPEIPKAGEDWRGLTREMTKFQFLVEAPRALFSPTSCFTRC